MGALYIPSLWLFEFSNDTKSIPVKGQTRCTVTPAEKALCAMYFLAAMPQGFPKESQSMSCQKK